MRDRIAKIFKASGFETDRAVHIMTSALETDLDVCALYQEVLIIVECKTGTNISFGNLISEWDSKRTEIINEKNTLKVLISIDGVVTQQRLKAIENFKVVIAFRDYSPTPDQIGQARNYGIEILDSDAIEYYERTSNALGSWTKYEIFKEMNIKRREEAEVIPRPALRLRQPGAELYMFTLAPYRLLRIAYVYRRSLKERYAYQRMVNQSRIERIGHFLNREQAFLPNAILLAFDPEISKKVSFTPRAPGDDIGEISIPMNYCSSWVVDGQHRLYGFIKTPYSEPPPERPEPVTKFDVLIVGLKDFEREDQAKTFVDVNDNQKRIDPTLLCDLTTFIGDLRHPLTWPSLLVEKLNSCEPWKNRIRIFEIERNKPITLAGFAKWALSKELLRRKELKDGRIQYVGPLFKYA